MTRLNKSLESTMKTICDKRRWGYAKNDTASKLLAVCFDNGLVPPFWVSHFSALRATLEAGVPTGRNKLSGHGQGQGAANRSRFCCELRFAHDRIGHPVVLQLRKSTSLEVVQTTISERDAGCFGGTSQQRRGICCAMVGISRLRGAPRRARG